MKTKSNICKVYAEGIGKSQTGSVVVGSVSVRFYEPRLVGYVSFPGVPLIPLVSTALPPPLLQDSLSSV